MHNPTLDRCRTLMTIIIQRECGGDYNHRDISHDKMWFGLNWGKIPTYATWSTLQWRCVLLGMWLCTQAAGSTMGYELKCVHTSVVLLARWLEKPCWWNCYNMVCDTVHHVYIGSGSSVLLGFPDKVVDHLTGTTSALVVVPSYTSWNLWELPTAVWWSWGPKLIWL